MYFGTRLGNPRVSKKDTLLLRSLMSLQFSKVTKCLLGSPENEIIVNKIGQVR